MSSTSSPSTGPSFTVVFSLEALGQLRALPPEARERVQSRAEVLAWTQSGVRKNPNRSSMRSASVPGAQFFYELCPDVGALRVLRVIALPDESSHPTHQAG